MDLVHLPHSPCLDHSRKNKIWVKTLQQLVLQISKVVVVVVMMVSDGDGSGDGGGGDDSDDGDGSGGGRGDCGGIKTRHKNSTTAAGLVSANLV